MKQKILLIGGYGFLGSNILRWIDDNNMPYKVNVLSSIRSQAEKHTFSCVDEEFFGDFNDELFLKNAFINQEYDYVFHCISASTPASSNLYIPKDIELNLISTIRLLDILKGLNSILVFFGSGGAVYGVSESIVHRVGDVPNPISSYGIMKNAIEQYINLYNRLYGLRFLTLRISNPYGPYHKSNIQGIINIAIRKALKNDTIEVWGDGENLKDYIYSEDIPKIIFRLLEAKRLNTTFNIGSGKGISINSILAVLKCLDPTIKVIYKDYKSHDVAQFILDISPIGDMIELTSLQEGIRRTYSWQMQIT